MGDNQKKYEEAAKASMQVWIDELQQRGEMVMGHGQQVYLRGFLAGASFADKEKTLEYKLAIATSAVLKEALDKLEALQEELKIAKKEAHNVAIDQAIKIVAETRCRDSVHHELEKLKI